MESRPLPQRPCQDGFLHEWNPRGTHPLQHLKSIHLRHHNVEDYDVKGIGAGEVQSFLAIAGAGHGVALFAQAAAKQFQHSPLVFHNEQIHRAQPVWP